MKERIYSIPLTETLEQSCGCILCALEKKLEQQAVEYFLGPSMMEPDAREITNEKGFCQRHMLQLFEKNNRLSLALTLETHVKDIREKLGVVKKQGFFSKESAAFLTGESISKITQSCALCDKLNSQMADAAGNLAYLWDKDKDFRQMFENAFESCRFSDSRRSHFVDNENAMCSHMIFYVICDGIVFIKNAGFHVQSSDIVHFCPPICIVS